MKKRKKVLPLSEKVSPENVNVSEEWIVEGLREREKKKGGRDGGRERGRRREEACLVVDKEKQVTVFGMWKFGDVTFRAWALVLGYCFVWAKLSALSQNIRGEILLMQPLPLVAKAYSMLRQEEKQRDFPEHSSQTLVTLNTYRNAYTPPYRNNNLPNTPNNPINGPQTERRSTFRKGIFCGYCKKERHPKEECYKLLGYPPGHPLHNKYQPPSQRTQQANRGQRLVNMMTGDTLPIIDIPLHPMSPPDQYSTSTTLDVAESQVHARMDLLQNQLNQVILMMQNQHDQAETSGATPHVEGILSFSDYITILTKVTGIHSFNSAAKMYSFIASHMTKPKSHFIWVVDSGATDLMHYTNEHPSWRTLPSTTYLNSKTTTTNFSL
ncbi:hypothetical protein Tco_1438189 [Tanacetum coccineum]